MADSMNQVMVKTIVAKAIRDIKVDPERTVRNLVDMAMNFADSRFQQQFYSGAQALLANENSGYYSLVRDTVTKVNEETMLTFGMNVGYLGLFRAAGQIRELESKRGYNIPWTVSLTIAEGKLYDKHHQVIRQGEALGIHTWHLFSHHGVYECMSLASQHPESAFVIFCGSHEVDWNVLDCASDLRNVAFLLPFDTESELTCSLLREAGILFGLYRAYSAKDLLAIESGKLLHDMERLNPLIVILKPQFPCDQSVRDRVCAWITNARLGQEFRTILWELYGDMLMVDNVISEDPCWAGFDEYGQLNTEKGVNREFGLNIFKQDLPAIFQRAFPKQNHVGRPESSSCPQ